MHGHQKVQLTNKPTKTDVGVNNQSSKKRPYQLYHAFL